MEWAPILDVIRLLDVVLVTELTPARPLLIGIASMVSECAGDRGRGRARGT